MLQKVAEDSEGNEFAELSIEFGDFFGLSLRGTFNENDSFEMSYYYPYFCGNKISTTEQIDIEKHAEKESYAGICDEVRLGVTLIFYLQNVADYLAVKNNKFYMSQANGKGTVFFYICKLFEEKLFKKILFYASIRFS